MLLTADAERRYVRAIFHALDASEPQAAAVADVLTEGDLRGHGSHGLVRVPLNVGLLRAGNCQPDPHPFVARERASAVLMDGDRALGPYAATIAVQEAIARARGLLD